MALSHCQMQQAVRDWSLITGREDYKMGRGGGGGK